MRIAETVEMLELRTILANGPGVIHPLVIWDEQDVVLFDAGLPGMEVDFRQAAQRAHIPFDRLSKVLITHSDMDHIGSLSKIVSENGTEVTVMAHEAEKPYIECDLPPIRLKQMEAGLQSATGEFREQMEALTQSLKRTYRLLRVTVNRTVQDGETLPFCGGITAIHTPGHTPGHMCYYLHKYRILVAGDLLQLSEGRLTLCPDITIVDKEAIAGSIYKVSRLQTEAVVCYHGGLFQGNASQQIERMMR